MVCDIEYQYLFFYFQSALASLGIFFCLCIIALYVFRKDSRVFSHKLISYLSLSLSIYLAMYDFPIETLKENNNICIAVDSIGPLFGACTSAWICCISLVLYQLIVRCSENIEIFEKIFFIVCSILLGIMIVYIVILYLDILSVDCTYNYGLLPTLIKIITILIPIWIFTIITIYCYYKIFKTLNYFKINQSITDLVRRLYYYPIVLVFNVILTTAYHALLFFTDDNCNAYLIALILYCIMSTSGIINGVIFFTTFKFNEIKRGSENYAVEVMNYQRLSSFGSINLLETENYQNIV